MNNPFSTGSAMGIKKRLILVLLIILIPFLLLETFVFYRWFHTRKAVEMQANLELARAVAINIETYLQGLIRDELAIGLALTASQPLLDEDRDRIIDILVADNPAICGIYWINSAGTVIASSPRSSIDLNLSDRSYFRAVMEGKDSFVSELIVGKVTKKPAFVVSRAIRTADGALLGVVAAAIEPDRLESVLGISRSEDAGVSLVDNKGMHVSRFPPTEYTWEQRNWLKLYPIIEESLKGAEITAEVTSGTTGKKRLTAFVPISSIGWVAASSRAENDVTQAIFQVLMPQIWLALLLTIAAFTAAVGLSRPIIQCISRMNEHAAALGRGEMAQIVPDGPQELKTLAATMNEMAEKVQLREESIRRLNETLEQQVAERSALAEARAKHLQKLAVDLIEAEERERRRFAGLLHDDLQQMLVATRMQLDFVCQIQPNEPTLSNIRQLLEESIAKSRHLSHELSPPGLQHSNLSAALQWIARYFYEQFGLQVELQVDEVYRTDNNSIKVYLFRAVQELLFNVIKHAGVKSARVALSKNNGCLMLTVSDKGSGFDPAILDSATAPVGLGLLSLRERARYLGGSLMIESGVLEPGSRFTLSVPFSILESKHPEAPRLRANPSEVACAIPSGITRILFVDDHKVIRQGLIGLIAGQPGIIVAGEASNGREAIEQVKQLKPDVVVMDVSMPVMDGIEATRHIKLQWPDVRVIALSMVEDEHVEQTMREAGAESFVSKTASSSELLKAIFKIAPQ
jgi:signal transduction histidine kinase